MKYTIIIIGLFFFSSCKNRDENMQFKNSDSIDTTSSNKNPNTQRWIEYQRKAIGFIDAQLSYKNCYFKIEKHKFYYYKNDSLNYVDEFVINKTLNKTFFFKNNLDEIIFEKDSNQVILKRDNYEGEYEYFKRCK